MNPAFYLVWLMVFMGAASQRRRAAAVRQIAARRKKGESIMNSEIVRRYIGKKCDVYTIMSNLEVYQGTIEEVADNWIVCRDKSNEHLINLEYVVRIKEYPEKK